MIQRPFAVLELQRGFTVSGPKLGGGVIQADKVRYRTPDRDEAEWVANAINDAYWLGAKHAQADIRKALGFIPAAAAT